MSTDVKNLVSKDEIGVNTKVAATTDANIATHTTFAQAGSQAGALTKDTGCDGKPATQTVNSGNQMDVLEQATQQVECNILVPSEESGEEEEGMEKSIDCFKCKGS